MFEESHPIAYDAPADLKKWPSLKNQRLNGRPPYLMYNGTLADCIKLLLAKPIRQISLYDIVTEPQPIFERPVAVSRRRRRNRDAQGFSERLEPFPFRWNRNGALVFCFDAFSSREPVPTSLENALEHVAASAMAR